MLRVLAVSLLAGCSSPQSASLDFGLLLVPRERWPIERWSPDYLALIEDRASGSGAVTELFVITSNRARGELFEVLVFSEGAEVRYRQERWDAAEFRRVLTARELARLRELVETLDLDARGDFTDSGADDGWHYIYRHLAPSGLHMFMADNPDLDPRGKPYNEAYNFFAGLLDVGKDTDDEYSQVPPTGTTTPCTPKSRPRRPNETPTPFALLTSTSVT